VVLRLELRENKKKSIPAQFEKSQNALMPNTPAIKAKRLHSSLTAIEWAVLLPPRGSS
jgi:hypothetical protein